MPISVDNIIQMASGTFEGSSSTMVLPSGTTAGSTVIALMGAGGATSGSYTLTNPATVPGNVPMVQIGSGQIQPTRASVRIAAASSVAAGLTTWTISSSDGTSKLFGWVLLEISGVGSDPAIGATNLSSGVGGGWYARDSVSGAVAAATSLVASATSRVVPHTTKGPTECVEGLGLQVVAATSADTTTPVISGYDGEYTELAQVTVANASVAFSFAVAAGQYLDIGNFDAGVSVAPDAYLCTDLVVVHPDDSRRVAKYYLISGAEIGTITNATNWTFPGTAANGVPALRGTVGSPEIVSTIKRTGSYGYKLSSSGAAESITLFTSAADGINPTTLALRLHCYFETSLPGSDVELASFEATSSLANGMKLMYRAASQKLEVQVDTGTAVLSDATVAADTWIGVDLRFLVNGNAPPHRCDWQVDYNSLDSSADAVVQTTALGTLTSALTITTARIGWTTATSHTVYYDDLVLSHYYTAYPIGDVRLVPLRVDTAGTVTVTGTAGNFRTYTGGPGGTLTALASPYTAVKSALDDIPPTIAGGDGLVQVTAAAGDYVDIPIETYALAPLYTPRALRIYWAGSAVGTNPATCNLVVVDANGVEAYRATSGTSLDFDFDDTTVKWITGMLTRVTSGVPSWAIWYEVTQAILDGLSVRWGYSEDATPDVGLHAVLFELAVQPAKARGLTSAEDGTFSAYGRFDPISGALSSVVVTTPVGGSRGATLYLDSALSGVPDSQYVAGDSFAEVSVGATRVSDVPGYALAVDPSDE